MSSDIESFVKLKYKVLSFGGSAWEWNDVWDILDTYPHHVRHIWSLRCKETYQRGYARDHPIYYFAYHVDPEKAVVEWKQCTDILFEELCKWESEHEQRD